MTLRRLSLTTAMLLLGMIGGCSDSSTPDQQAQPAAPTEPAAADADTTDATQTSASFDLGEQAGEVTRYRCDDGTELELAPYQYGASLSIGDQQDSLQQEAAASGTFYKGAQWSVHLKEGAMLLIGRSGTQGCFAQGGVDTPSVEVEDPAQIEDAY